MHLKIDVIAKYLGIPFAKSSYVNENGSSAWAWMVMSGAAGDGG